MSCNCNCHDPDYNEHDSVDDLEDNICPECDEGLDDKSICQNKECDYFELCPFDNAVGSWTDEQKWERQQMGIC